MPFACRLPHRCLRLLTALLVSTLLGACASLPPRGAVPPTQALALADTERTTLALIAASSLQAATGLDATPGPPSAFRTLSNGEFALDARLTLARRAERSLDIQSYHLHPDRTGLALLRELRDAAARGVRVRLLVDDLHAAEVTPLLADLARQPGVQVRLFGPLALRQGAPLVRLLLSPGDFERHNRRMHNKLFIADNAFALVGGRNIADEYFMGHAEANFIDLDLIAAGAVLPELSAVFDTYWNSEPAWPVQRVLGQPLEGLDADQVNAARLNLAALGKVAPSSLAERPGATDALSQTSVHTQMQQGRLGLIAGSAQVFADPPSKATETVTRQTASTAMAGLLGVLAGARQEAYIVSPYFLPGSLGLPMMTRAAQAGVRMVVFTNSMGTTDEPLVHLRYSSYRVAMLKLGVEIHELSPGQTRRSLEGFGASTPRLHAKAAVVDRRQVLVGSVNLDARSAIANTEMALAIDSPGLARALSQLMQHDITGTQYRLRLAADGRTIEWISRDAQGQETATRDEPDAGFWKGLVLWLQSLLVANRLL